MMKKGIKPKKQQKKAMDKKVVERVAIHGRIVILETWLLRQHKLVLFEARWTL